MANLIKPLDINKIWSASGDILAPSDTKISQGWQVEIPSRQHFNYIDNKQDQAIAHINQHGIAVWDSQTEYQANSSYTQGSDGNIYKCNTTATNVNPVGDVSGTWTLAFVTPGSATQVATAAQARAQTANNVFMSPLQLANAFTGGQQSITATGFQKLPGGLIIQWGTATAGANNTEGPTTPFSIPFPTQVFTITATHGLSSSATAALSIGNTNNTSFTVRGAQTQTVGVTFIAIGY